ncbi:hypothetical protein KBC75_03345 [Candidatus Shapirobacteria bacterium]|nr:hypothetical protein [Candidatus Shapirobacteria bacterium]
MEKIPHLDPIGYLLIFTLLFSLSYAGYLSYKSIDWNVLKRVEQQSVSVPVSLGTPATTSATPQPASP